MAFAGWLWFVGPTLAAGWLPLAAAPSGGGAPSLDASAGSRAVSTVTTSGTTMSVSITPSATGECIVVLTGDYSNSGSGGGTFVLTDTAGWTWQRRYTTPGTDTSSGINEWTGVSGATLSNTITITISAATLVFDYVSAFSIANCQTSSGHVVVDGNLAGGPVNGATVATLSLTTTNANDFAYAACFAHSSAFPTNGSPYTTLVSVNSFGTEYNIYSSTQSGTTIAWGNSPSCYEMIVDAIK